MDIIFVFLCSRVNPLYIIFFGLFGFAYGCMFMYVYSIILVINCLIM